MKKLSIVTVPNPKLKEVANKVTSFINDDKNLETQISEMVKLLRKEGGIGLAANQIGYSNQVVIAEFKDPDGKEHIPLSVFINPEIVNYSEGFECFEEGCLSVPKIELDVTRPSSIKIKYQDISGKKIKSAPKGLFSRILQHEVDHLNGVLFTERMRDQFFREFKEFKNIKIAFFGSGIYASIILEGLILIGFNLEIYTEKAKPAGRDNLSKSTPVALVAEKFSKKYSEIENILNLEIPESDLIIASDFGQKIPDSTLSKARITAINIHPSMLPKYLGPTPIQTAILNQDKSTGVSIIKMTNKIDEGPIYSQIEVKIDKNSTYPQLRDRLATLGLRILIKTLPKIVRNKIEFMENDISKGTRTCKFEKEDGQIDWSKPIKDIYSQFRAFYIWPGSFTFINDKRYIIHKMRIKKDKLTIGVIQQEGKKPLKFSEFLRGFKGLQPKWFEKILIDRK